MEGRVLRADFGDITVLNCYFPSGTSGEIRQSVKMAFLADLYNWVDELRKERPNLIICGDYNIAHTEIDIHDPVRNKKSSGFLPEERAWMSKWFENGYTDAFRFKNPDLREYSWWTYRAGARGNNKGWRIDYISVSIHD
jgi:exodeoxyribonuclease-3